MLKMVSKAQNSRKSLRNEAPRRDEDGATSAPRKNHRLTYLHAYQAFKSPEPRYETTFGRRQAVPVIDALSPAPARQAKPNAGRARLKKWTNALALSVAGQPLPRATKPGEGLGDPHIIEWRRP